MLFVFVAASWQPAAGWLCPARCVGALEIMCAGITLGQESRGALFQAYDCLLYDCTGSFIHLGCQPTSPKARSSCRILSARGAIGQPAPGGAILALAR